MYKKGASSTINAPGLGPAGLLLKLYMVMREAGHPIERNLTIGEESPPLIKRLSSSPLYVCPNYVELANDEGNEGEAEVLIPLRRGEDSARVLIF